MPPTPTPHRRGMPSPSYGRAAPQPAGAQRDSNALRASVLDVFAQLGALQKNSLITQWMFEEDGGAGAGAGAVGTEERRGRREGSLYGAYGYGENNPLTRTTTGIQEETESEMTQNSSVGADSQDSETRRGGRSKFSKFTAVFRGRSKSKTRAGKASRNGAETPVPPPPPIPSTQSTHSGDTTTTSTGYETDEGYNSSSPATPSGKRSKSRRRGISVFPTNGNKPRPSESSEFSPSSRPSTPSEHLSSRPSRDRDQSRTVSPFSEISATTPFTSMYSRPVSPAVGGGGLSATPFPSISSRPVSPGLGTKMHINRRTEESSSSVPTDLISAPTALSSYTKPNPDSRRTETPELSESKQLEVGGGGGGGATSLLRRLSFAIPRSNFQKPTSSSSSKNDLKRKTSTRKPRPPSLLPIQTEIKDNIGSSHSLPPSPFILVVPEMTAAEFAGTPDTPYVLCTPVDDETARARLSQPFFNSLNNKGQRGQGMDSPLYPLSVSKTLRRSMVLDGLNHSDEHLPLGGGGTGTGTTKGFGGDNDKNDDDDDDTTRLNRALSMQTLQGEGPLGTKAAAAPPPSSYPRGRVTFADDVTIEGDVDDDDGVRRPGLRRSLSATQRAREAPFPTRPVLPIPLSLSIHGPNARAVRLSLDARASVIRQRYRSGIVEG
ncbi:hypothetical protein K435DRAFT_806251 [Dendrothele bispora CBS 962.96]|uniref:Uncharacterized protein n=1 Tax=Dendrothele bispora (strain CBS 962.96) TaxID=1314807 RepID=A0A4S8L975_DENBC|nr:hypothetical protein K435DRAFT_806251 [Dendrothele bispora CBS 962.96]